MPILRVSALVAGFILGLFGASFAGGGDIHPTTPV